MISLLAPMAFVGAMAASLAITLLHFLSVRRPPPYLLPTARFIATRDVRAVSRSARPSDLKLLALRVLALLLAGLALSTPRFVADGASRATVIVADRTWSADSARMRDLTGAGSDSPVRTVWADSGAAAGMRAELGAAWPLAWRAAAAMLADHAGIDSVDLHVLAPDATLSVAGWDSWRATWPGRVVVHARPVRDDSVGAAARDPRGPVRVVVDGASGDDVVRAAFALHAPTFEAPDTRGITVRVLRASTAGDTADALVADSTLADADVLVSWPVGGVPPSSRRTTPDTIGALVARGSAIVARWTRAASFDMAAVVPNDASATGTGSAPRAIAWWSDGRAAAIELPRAASTVGVPRCARHVAIDVPSGSDLLLSASARGVLAALAAPCGPAAVPVPVRILRDGTSTADSATAPAQRGLAPAAALRRLSPVAATVAPSWLPAALLALSIALLLLEWAVRDREAGRARGLVPDTGVPLERVA